MQLVEIHGGCKCGHESIICIHDMTDPSNPSNPNLSASWEAAVISWEAVQYSGRVAVGRPAGIIASSDTGFVSRQGGQFYNILFHHHFDGKHSSQLSIARETEIQSEGVFLFPTADVVEIQLSYNSNVRTNEQTTSFLRQAGMQCVFYSLCSLSHCSACTEGQPGE